jgi:hypothetical protein
MKFFTWDRSSLYKEGAVATAFWVSSVLVLSLWPPVDYDFQHGCRAYFDIAANVVDCRGFPLADLVGGPLTAYVNVFGYAMLWPLLVGLLFEGGLDWPVAINFAFFVLFLLLLDILIVIFIFQNLRRFFRFIAKQGF